MCRRKDAAPCTDGRPPTVEFSCADLDGLARTALVVGAVAVAPLPSGEQSFDAIQAGMDPLNVLSGGRLSFVVTQEIGSQIGRQQTEERDPDDDQGCRHYSARGGPGADVAITHRAKGDQTVPEGIGI